MRQGSKSKRVPIQRSQNYPTRLHRPLVRTPPPPWKPTRALSYVYFCAPDDQDARVRVIGRDMRPSTGRPPKVPHRRFATAYRLEIPVMHLCANQIIDIVFLMVSAVFFDGEDLGPATYATTKWQFHLSCAVGPIAVVHCSA